MSLPSFANTLDLTVADDLAAAAQAIRGYCRWHVWPIITQTLTLDGPGGRLLTLPTMRLISVSDVTEDGEDVDVTVPHNWWSVAGWMRKPIGRWWTDEPGAITLTITHGYAELPADLKRLSVDLAKRMADNPGGLRRLQVGQRAEDYATKQLLEDERAQLDPYRRLV